MNLNLSNQAKGTLYSVIGVLIITPDSLLVREVSQLPDFVVIFYKFIFLAAFLTIVLLAIDPKEFTKAFTTLGYIGWGASLIWGISSFLVTIALQTTAVANVLVILAANPLFSSILSYVLLKESIPLRTIAAGIVCFIAILIIFYSQLGAGGGDTIGLVCALGASFTMASYFVLLSLSQKRTGLADNIYLCSLIFVFEKVLFV